MPPSLDALARLADQCVLCGLCLPQCPTYTLDQQESESPRGRISLIHAIAESRIDPSIIDFTHLDHCLGCGRCEAVCPAKVNYGELLTGARAWQREKGFRRESVSSRWRRRLLAHPVALNRLLGMARWLWPLLPSGLRQGMPRPPPRPHLHVTAKQARSRGEVSLFLGCISRRYSQTALQSAVDLLQRLGWSVRVNAGQTCCGTQAAHAGDASLSESLRRRNARAFDAAEVVISLDSGCHEQINSSIDGRAVDILDFIADDIRTASLARASDKPRRIAVFAPCTQRNVVGSDVALTRLLSTIPGLEVQWLQAGCCGAAGSHMLEFPARAARLRDPLIEQIANGTAEQVLCANIGCRLHLQNGLSARGIRIPIVHPIEFFASILGQTDAPE